MKNRLDYYVILLLGMVSFVSLIRAIFPMSGWKFYLELLATIVLACFFAVAMVLVFNKVNAGYILSSIVSALVLFNLLIIYYRSSMSTNLFTGIIASMTLFVVSIVSVPGKEDYECECCAKPEETVEPAKVEEPKIEAMPGSVVSSKTASYYHLPMCDWAQKIKPENRVWYDSESQAKKAGLKAHTCLKHPLVK